MFNETGAVLGLFEALPQTYFGKEKSNRLDEMGFSEKDIQSLITQRAEARKRKDWETADKVRNSLEEKGILLKDTPHGTEWTFQNT